MILFSRSKQARKHGVTRRVLHRAAGLVCFAGLALPICAQDAQTPPAPETPPPAPASDSTADFFDVLGKQVKRELEKCHDAVVRIEATDEHGKLAGTGFFVDPNGLLYTSYTVAGESRDLVVCRGEMKYPAKRLAADRRSGIAILQVETQTCFLPLGNTKEIATGTPMMTFGYPLDLPLTPSFGLLGGFDRKYLGRYFATTHMRANLSVQRGEGGAPLLNMKGEVVGILISSLDHGSASFALPIEAAEKVRRDFQRFGQVRPGWLGLQMENAPAPVHGSTALVQDLMPGSPASKGGLQIGDYILEIAGRSIASPEDMVDASYFLTAEDTVPVRVTRGNQDLFVQVQAADPPSTATPPVLGSSSGLEKGVQAGMQLGGQ